MCVKPPELGVKERIIIKICTIVQQPEHAKKKLLNYQKKYGISTKDFTLQMPNIPDRNDWYFQYEMFLECGGQASELEGQNEPLDS